MHLIKYLWETESLRLMILIVLGILLIMFTGLYFIHIKRIRKGEHSKFLWMESDRKHKQMSDAEGIKGKNINTGTNYGKIGDN